MNKVIMIAAISVAFIAGTLTAGTWVEATSTKQIKTELEVLVLNDDKIGHDAGWDPDGLETNFQMLLDIPVWTGPQTYKIHQPAESKPSQCYAPVTTSNTEGGFVLHLSCSTPPPNGSALHIQLVWEKNQQT